MTSIDTSQPVRNSINGMQTRSKQQHSDSLRHWFVAKDLYLSLACSSGKAGSNAAEPTGDTNTDPQCALFEGAIVLAEHEPLLTCIDHWYGDALDWEPLLPGGQVSQPANSTSQPVAPDTVDVTLSSLRGPARSVGLALTDQHLASLPAFPPELAELTQVAWRQIPVTLQVDHFDITDDDVKRLGPGALVLMPASFSNDWIGSVCEVPGAALPASVRIEPVTGNFQRLADQVPNDVSPTEPTSVDNASMPLPQTLSVILGKPIEVDVRRWRAMPVAENYLAECGPLCGKTVRLELATGNSQSQFFSGEILSLGSGHAVRISQQSDRS